MKKPILLLVALISFSLGTSHAALIFSDDFNSENGGVGVLNYAGFSQWTVTGGTVDLIGSLGFWDYFPANGLYVDMDGSTGDAGKMTTSPSLSLLAGDYTLSFDLAGNQRNSGSEQVDVVVAVGFASTVVSLGQNAPFSSYSLNFTLPTASNVTISFEGSGGDNIGMLLDNVRLNSVPDGSNSLVLLGAALLGLVYFRRRFA